MVKNTCHLTASGREEDQQEPVQITWYSLSLDGAPEHKEGVRSRQVRPIMAIRASPSP